MHCRDDSGEAMPAAILFLGVIFTILVAVQILVVSLARTTVQSAADYAVAAAQAAAPGTVPCGANPPPQCCDSKQTTAQPSRQCEGEFAARRAMLRAPVSVRELHRPEIVVQEDRGVVSGLVRGVVISPIFGAMEITGLACGPLDTVPEHLLTDPDSWEC